MSVSCVPGRCGPTAWAGQVSQGGYFLWVLILSSCILKPQAQTGMGPSHGTFPCSAAQTYIHCLLHGHGQQVKADKNLTEPWEGWLFVLLPLTATGTERQGQDRTMTHPYPLSPQPLSQRFLQLSTKPKGKNVKRVLVCIAPCSHRQLEAPHSHR